MQPAHNEALAAVLCLFLAACTASASETEPADPSAAASIPTGASCAPIDLRLPSGERLDLTGTWRGNELVHHVRQIGDCVWWIAYSDKPGQALGALYTITFLGHLRSDYTLAGDWAGIVHLDDPGPYFGPSATEGSVEFEIVFDPETAEVTLAQHGTSGPNTGRTAPDYPLDFLRFVGPLPEPQAP